MQGWQLVLRVDLVVIWTGMAGGSGEESGAAMCRLFSFLQFPYNLMLTGSRSVTWKSNKL